MECPNDSTVLEATTFPYHGYCWGMIVTRYDCDCGYGRIELAFDDPVIASSPWRVFEKAAKRKHWKITYKAPH